MARDGAAMSVLLLDASDRGGIARYTDCLRVGLEMSGARVRRAGPPPVGDPDLPLHALAWGPDMAAKGRGALWATRASEVVPAAWALERALGRARAEVAHFQTEIVPGIDPLMLRLASRRTAVVLTVHDPLPLEGGARAAADQARRWRRADALILHDEQPRAFVEASAPGVPVHVVPVDLPLGGAPVGRAEARRRLGIDARTPVALLLGQLRSYKGLRLLAEAWPQVRAALPAAQLALVGQAYPSEDLDRLTGSDGVVVRAGFLDEGELDTWAAAADLLVLPYLSGGHSGILHRGLAAGTPVLSSPTLAEEVRRTGAGIVVPLDASAWAVAMRAALGDRPLPAPPAPGSGETVTRTLEVYADVLARRGSR